MENTRRDALFNTMKRFNKQQKEEVFTLGSDIEETALIPSGIKAFDDYIGGGIKKGAHTIIYGTYSVGKTSLIMHLIANAQNLNQLVCYVNTEKPIAPERFEFFGVDLKNLIYIEAPSSAELALEALRTLCKDKVIDLFIIDSTNGLCPIAVQEGKEGAERGLDKKNVAALPMTLSNFYNVVNAHIFKAKAAVIWAGQMRTKGIGGYFVRDGLTGGNAQTFFAYQIVFMRRDEKSNNPTKDVKHYFMDMDGKIHHRTEKEETGFGVVFKLDKTNSCKSAKEKTELRLPFTYDDGFQTSNDEADEEIEIDGTDEEKTKIRSYLLEKGAKLPSLYPQATEEAIKTSVETSTKIENESFKFLDDSREDIYTEKDGTPIQEPKKRRGRPRKSNG